MFCIKQNVFKIKVCVIFWEKKIKRKRKEERRTKSAWKPKFVSTAPAENLLSERGFGKASLGHTAVLSWWAWLTFQPKIVVFHVLSFLISQCNF